ncbi:MAG: glycosyltransferase [Hyphomicrobiaceae bacterium]|nr:glycosyltransferase [Hyphomicrobiaceae bacterium]
MRLVVFGLSITSSWGNGHATLWRGLVRALARRGCRVSFFERDEPYYAASRDLGEIAGAEIVLYSRWSDVRGRAAATLGEADAAIVTSYCHDGIAAAELMLDRSRGLALFYDLDSPVTLASVGSGQPLSYIGPRGLADFDLVLSYAGGRALEELRLRLGARRVLPLYGHADPDVHHAVPPAEHYRADLSYLGTYAADRQAAVEALFAAPARERPAQRFLIGGAQYPPEMPWPANIHSVGHLPPFEHPAFYCSSRLTLNVTRRTMAEMGWCPSGRLFEAAACGAAIISDTWPGLDSFFEPGREILLAQDADEVLAALDLSDGELARIANAARERTFAEHTSDCRAEELLEVLSTARAPAKHADPPGEEELPSPLRGGVGGGGAPIAGVSPVAPPRPRAFRCAALPVKGRASEGRGSWPHRRTRLP